MKKKRKLNGPQIIGLVLAGGFLLWNILWGINVMVTYLPYYNKLPDVQLLGMRFISEDGYLYSVKIPNYLSFTGNLSVVDSNTNESLIIWLSIFGNHKYGVRLQLSEDVKKEADNDFSFLTLYEMYVDQNGNPTGHKNQPNAQEAWEKKKSTIHTLFKMSEQYWNLLGTNASTSPKN